MGIPETFWVPGKDLIGIHVINIEVDHIAGDAPGPELMGYIKHFLIRVITPPALLKTEAPVGREWHPAGEPGVIPDNTCNS